MEVECEVKDRLDKLLQSLSTPGNPYSPSGIYYFIIVDSRRGLTDSPFRGLRTLLPQLRPSVFEQHNSLHLKTSRPWHSQQHLHSYFSLDSDLSF